MISPFLKRISQAPILGDGAMGTYLYAKGASFNLCFDELNISNAKLVGQVHDDYIGAGSELIETNTYGANRNKLAQHGFEPKVREINLRGAKIARDRREVSGKDIYVAGAIGPLGKLAGRFRGIGRSEIREIYAEQADALLEGGVDLFIVETISDLEELRLAVEEIHRLCKLPVIGQITISDDLTTANGDTPLELIQVARELKLEVVGVNCSVGPQRLYDFVSILRSMTDLPISAQPNAGLPRFYEGRFFYVSSPDYFADYCRKFLSLGLAIIGGCCGTTPEHIRAMRAVFDSFQRKLGAVAAVEVTEPEQKPELAAPTPKFSNFAAKLGTKFVVSVEIDPPRGANPEKVLKAAARLHESGVDAVNVADSPMAK